MKYLRNKRTGKLVVFDERLLALGTYEVVESAPRASKPIDQDFIQATDRVQICLTRSTGESIECET